MQCYPREIYAPDMPTAAGLIASVHSETDIATFLSQVWAARAVGGACVGGWSTIDEHIQLLGVGLISPSEISFDFWGISWVTVRGDYQRQGIGKVLMAAMEQHALAEQSRQSQPCVIQLAASIPEYYERLGYQRVMSYGGGNHFLMTKVLRD